MLPFLFTCLTCRAAFSLKHDDFSLKHEWDVTQAQAEAKPPAAAGPVPVRRNLHLHGFPVGNLPHTKAVLAQARMPTPSKDEVCCRSLPGHPDTRASSAHCDFCLPAEREQRAASDCILSGYPGFCCLMTIWTVERRLPPPSSCSQRGEMKRGLTWKNFNH